MKTIKVWFPGYITEAHRQEWLGAGLVWALYQNGIECSLTMDSTCTAVLCGSLFNTKEAELTYRKYSVPVIHYCWDLYPFQVEGKHRNNPGYDGRWQHYVQEIKKCKSIIVPSRCTIDRVQQYANRESIVVKSSVRTFTEEVTMGNYVLNAMGHYPDPNAHLAREACTELGIPILESSHRLTWEEYKKAVANCRFLISAQYEASTGGLSMLEAYALGKPILLSNSPRHGGIDYMEDRGIYFQWDSKEDLKSKINTLYHNTPRLDQQECRHWVDSEYSEWCMANGIAEVIRQSI